jgi:hypothetical protein
MFHLIPRLGIDSRSEALVPRPKYKEEDFPPAGTVFVAPTSDGRLAAGRVLRRAFEGGAQAALIAATPWIGAAPPPLESSVLRETLILTHHNWTGKPELFWTWDLMPDDFQIIGQIELSESDRTASSGSYTSWGSVSLQALMQWRWDHDREALLRDEADAAARLAELNRKRAEVRAEYLRTLTLDALAGQLWFASWEESEAKPPIAESRSVLVRLIHDLQKAPKLTTGAVKKRLKQAVVEFNRLDEVYRFIATIEREDICEALLQVLCAAKFPQLENQIDQWRDW